MRKQKYETDIKLGEQYRETQTGVEGVATAIYFYQYGCERVQIEMLNKDGELKEYVFDAPRLQHVASGRIAEVTRVGGPKDHASTRPGPVAR